jgi:AbrB family looped-hinge helix DNA binding protein
MAKVTSKLQVTVPKAVADRLGIKPGDDVEWRVEGRDARVRLLSSAPRMTRAQRLALLDEMMQRHDDRARTRRRGRRPPRDRGWTREDLYTRGRAR